MNTNNLEMATDVIEQFAIKITNHVSNLGKAGVTGTSGNTNLDVAKHGGGMNDWGAMLTQEIQRRKDLIKPINDRKIVYNTYDPSSSGKQNNEDQQMQIQQLCDDEDEINDDGYSKDHMMRIKAMLEKEKGFKSKREIAMEKLLKSQIVTQVTIRFKLWNDDEITALFTP